MLLFPTGEGVSPRGGGCCLCVHTGGPPTPPEDLARGAPSPVFELVGLPFLCFLVSLVSGLWSLLCCGQAGQAPVGRTGNACSALPTSLSQGQSSPSCLPPLGSRPVTGPTAGEAPEGPTLPPGATVRAAHGPGGLRKPQPGDGFVSLLRDMEGASQESGTRDLAPERSGAPRRCSW